MTIHKCNYCKRDFADKTALNRHHKSAKFCIDIRNKQGIEVQLNTVKCQNCSKDFTMKISLERHSLICKKEKATPLPKNDVVSVSLDTYLTVSRIQEIFRHYTLSEYESLTPTRITEMVLTLLNGSNKPIYYCSDRARQRFFYIDSSGEVEDKQGLQLRTLIYNGVTPIFDTIHCNRLLDIEINIARYKRMGRDGDSLLASWRDDLKRLIDHQNTIDILKNSRDYLSAMSKQLPSKPFENTSTVQPIVLPTNSRLRMLLHEIDGYKLAELFNYRGIYIVTQKAYGPTKTFHEDNYDEYNFFLSATEEQLLERYR